MSYDNHLKQVINTTEKGLYLHPESSISALGPRWETLMVKWLWWPPGLWGLEAGNREIFHHPLASAQSNQTQAMLHLLLEVDLAEIHAGQTSA